MMRRRAGSYAMERAREIRREYVRANRRLLVVVNLGFVITVSALVVLAVLLTRRDVAFFGAGAASVSSGFMLWLSVENTPARRRFHGAEGERFTAGILRGLRWRRWKGAHNVNFLAGDVDHVVAGPGGVFAIETKWRSDSCPIVDGAFTNRWDRKALRQARFGAERIGWLLRGNYDIACEVKAVLVIWGPGRPKLTEPLQMGDVLVVTGHLLRGAIADSKAVDTNLASVVSQAIDNFSRIREQHGNECADWSAECACAIVGRRVETESASVNEIRAVSDDFRGRSGWICTRDQDRLIAS